MHQGGNAVGYRASKKSGKLRMSSDSWIHNRKHSFYRLADASFLHYRKLRPMTQKMLRGMRTCAKKKHVASGRAWRENVPRHILSCAGNEPKSVPAQNFGDCRDNLRNARNVFFKLFLV